MGYKQSLADYKSRIRLPDGSYKGVLKEPEAEIWGLLDENTGKQVGWFTSEDAVLHHGHAYGLNLLQSATENASESLPIATPTQQPEETPEMSYEEYCKHFENPKNKSGYRFITDQSESTGWVILKEGRSEYGRYGSVEDALREAYGAGLNL